MKKTIINILATTGAALIILGVFLTIMGGSDLIIRTFFEIFGANILIYAGLFFIRKIENRYAIMDFLLDITYTIIVLVVFGIIFDWYSSIPLWFLLVMAVVIYIIALLTDMVRVHNEAKEINKILQKRKKMDTNTAS